MSEARIAGRHFTFDGCTYAAGEEVPAATAARITNPAVWEPTEPAAVAAAELPRKHHSGPRLATHVTVDGRTYGPDDDVPEHVAARITNPAAWTRTEPAEPPAGVTGGGLEFQITTGTPGLEQDGDGDRDRPAELDASGDTEDTQTGDDTAGRRRGGTAKR